MGFVSVGGKIDRSMSFWRVSDLLFSIRERRVAIKGVVPSMNNVGRGRDDINFYPKVSGRFSTEILFLVLFIIKGFSDLSVDLERLF